MRFDGATALELDFGFTTTDMSARRGRPGLRLASPTGRLHGPDKYKVLDQRRRRAQIKARHLLEIMEEGK